MNEFEPRNFIEGSQTPEEEPEYWRLIRGEQASLRKLTSEGSLFAVAVDYLIAQGRVKLIPDNDDLIVLVSEKT